MSLRVMCEILAMRTGKSSPETERFTYKNNCKYNDHNPTNVCCRHFGSLASSEARILPNCLTSPCRPNYKYHFSAIISDVCDSLVIDTSLRGRSQSTLAWWGYLFQVSV